MGLFAEPKNATRATVRAIEPVPQLGANVRITPQARYYAVSELCRRAGIPGDFFRTWKVSATKEKTVFEIANGTTKWISFPHASPGQLNGLNARQFGSVTVPSLANVSGTENGEALLCHVPFVIPEGAARKPLFYLENPHHLACAVDLPLSILLMLSQWEDSTELVRDGHGRFPARNSLAFLGGYLDRPIVDEYGLAFEHAMQLLYPSWRRAERKLRIKVSHDVDHVGIPFRWRTAIRHTIRSRAPHNSIRDLTSSLSQIEPTELKSVRDLAMISREHGLISTVYWKAGPRGPMDSGYDPRHKKVREVVNWLNAIGAESGVHPGYNTYRSPEKLRREVMTLRSVLGDGPIGGRQHYLRWSPDTWIDWENCGLAHDSSVGYAEQIGFKAGTCVPYRPWLFPLNRQADLIEIPLLVMDRTLLGYMGLTKEQSIQTVKTLLARCRNVGGVFTILWHNDAFLDRRYRDVYVNLLEALSGVENYNWQSDHLSLSSH